MKQNIKYELISTIISFLHGEYYDATITSLASECNVPIPYMRKTLLAILENQIMLSCLDVESDICQNENALSFMEQYLENPDVIGTALLNGAYDHFTWRLTLNNLDNERNELLSLTSLELGSFLSFGKDILAVKYQPLFETKDILKPLSLDTRHNRETILTAIDNRRAISFQYRNNKGIIHPVQCYPIELTTNSTDNWIYMKSTEGRIYRLDRFIQHCKTITSSEPLPEKEADPYQKYVWGIYHEANVEPIHVKVKVMRDTSNIIRKFQNDIHHRKNTCKFYEKEGIYYYEDDIIGIPEFQRFLRGYGSSVIVLEPESLRKDIVESARQALHYYQSIKL